MYKFDKVSGFAEVNFDVGREGDFNDFTVEYEHSACLDGKW